MNSKPKALIVGMGSVGVRHAKCLSGLDCQVSVVTKRTDIEYPTYLALEEALEDESFNYVVIANDTGQHEQSLTSVLSSGHVGRILVEKPLFGVSPKKILQPAQCRKIFVGYNLRYHAVFETLKEQVSLIKPLAINIYAGQDVREWNSSRDIHETYRSRVGEGGALRDLSHELDYAMCLTGEWERVAAICGSFSSLNLATDDIAIILAYSKAGHPISIHLDYISKPRIRGIVVLGDSLTISGDFVNETVTANGENLAVGKGEDSYTKMHRDILFSQKPKACTYRQGLGLVKLIETIEKASKLRRWLKF